MRRREDILMMLEALKELILICISRDTIAMKRLG
jgi:hypothetical protein